MSLLQRLPSYCFLNVVTLTAGVGVGYASDPGGFGTFGVATPASVKDQFIRGLLSYGSADFVLIVNGTRPQDYFTSLVVVEQGGAERLYTSAAASFLSSTNSYWTWGNGSNQVWTAPGPQRNVTLF